MHPLGICLQCWVCEMRFCGSVAAGRAVAAAGLAPGRGVRVPPSVGAGLQGPAQRVPRAPPSLFWGPFLSGALPTAPSAPVAGGQCGRVLQLELVACGSSPPGMRLGLATSVLLEAEKQELVWGSLPAGSWQSGSTVCASSLVPGRAWASTKDGAPTPFPLQDCRKWSGVLPSSPWTPRFPAPLDTVGTQRESQVTPSFSPGRIPCEACGRGALHSDGRGIVSVTFPVQQH